MELRTTLDWRPIIEQARQYPGQWFLVREHAKRTDTAYATKHGLEWMKIPNNTGGSKIYVRVAQ